MGQSKVKRGKHTYTPGKNSQGFVKAWQHDIDALTGARYDCLNSQNKYNIVVEAINHITKY